MNPPTPDDPRDAHLVAALRHAPDRDVAPPAQLTAVILGQAQQALRARRTVPSGGWRAVWAQLWQPAPMAAFGTLAMATLIGVMWSAQEIPEATPSLRPEVVAVAPAAPLAEAAPAVNAVPAPAQAPGGADRDAAERSAAARKPAEFAPAPAPARRSAKADPPSTAAGRSVDAAAAEPEVRQAETVGNAAVATAMASAVPATPAPLPAPVARQAAPQEPDSRRDALAKSMADAAPAAARARNEMAPPAATLGAARPATASPLAAADIAAAMAGDATRVRWRVTAERAVAHEAAQRVWWSALARATQGRWQFAASTPTGGAEAASVALLIDGALRGTLAFEPQALVWRDASGAAWRVAIEPAQLREWQEAIARW